MARVSLGPGEDEDPSSAQECVGQRPCCDGLPASAAEVGLSLRTPGTHHRGGGPERGLHGPCEDVVLVEQEGDELDVGLPALAERSGLASGKW